jgi:hypothetical protein
MIDGLSAPWSGLANLNRTEHVDEIRMEIPMELPLSQQKNATIGRVPVKKNCLTKFIINTPSVHLSPLF